MGDIVYMDLETTGLEPDRHDIWEIGLVWPDGSEELYHLWPDLETADRNALRISGFYRRTRGIAGVDVDEPVCNNANRTGPNGGGLFDAPPRWSDPIELAADLAPRLDDVNIHGMLPSFDAQFLDPFLRANGQAGAWHYHVVDLEPMIVGWLHGRRDAMQEMYGVDAVRRVEAEPPYRSDDLSIQLGVEPPTGRDRHTAFGDARWCRRVHAAITGVEVPALA